MPVDQILYPANQCKRDETKTLKHRQMQQVQIFKCSAQSFGDSSPPGVLLWPLGVRVTSRFGVQWVAYIFQEAECLVNINQVLFVILSFDSYIFLALLKQICPPKHLRPGLPDRQCNCHVKFPKGQSQEQLHPLRKLTINIWSYLIILGNIW